MRKVLLALCVALSPEVYPMAYEECRKENEEAIAADKVAVKVIAVGHRFWKAELRGNGLAGVITCAADEVRVEGLT